MHWMRNIFASVYESNHLQTFSHFCRLICFLKQALQQVMQLWLFFKGYNFVRNICYSRKGRNTALPDTVFSTFPKDMLTRVRVHPCTQMSVKAGFYETSVNLCRNVQSDLQINHGRKNKSLQRKCRYFSPGFKYVIYSVANKIGRWTLYYLYQQPR
jgi:hypothetical protein